ncbi:MAG TPA: L-threonylcarbamoyladenylate synthase [Ideonella sp.]|nr:L-threonylcarbamoyladenylate synthase [Ideonella sp.]
MAATIWDGSDPAAVERGAERIAAGELLAFPTETVYGLGARADDDAAVAKIYAAKGRPAGHPLIVHVADAAAARTFAAQLSPVAERLMAAFWPGPLTLIVPRASGVATAAAGAQNSIGLRSPSHPVARALLAAAARRGVAGIAAPSANRYGRVSPTRAAHVVEEFGDAVPVLDGGACEVGIESAIVDTTRGRPVLLRPGQIDPARLQAAAGEPLRERDEAAPRAPGTLTAHYAPRAAVRLMETDLLRRALEVLGPAGPKGATLAVYSRTVPAPPGIRRRRMPATAAGAAHDLFAALRELDAEGVGLIWVEAPPATPEWDGVRDRLRRAAAAS